MAVTGKERKSVMLKPEEMRVGRRNFLKAAATIPAIGAYAYTAQIAKPLEAAIIGTGNQGRVLLENADPSYITFNAICDIRPDHREMGAWVVRKKYNPEVRVYKDVDKMLADGGFEAVLIATPLSTHAALALKCMAAGKHVFTEKTMAYTSEDCVNMIDTANRSGLILGVGHQRNANPLYVNAKKWIEDGLVGDVYHIRSLWHRNTNWRNNPSWKSEVLKEVWGVEPVQEIPKVKEGITPAEFKELPEAEQTELYFKILQLHDPEFDWTASGYQTADELANWRLYRKYSHGLMSELGSHQIAVANWFWGSEPHYVAAFGDLLHYKTVDARDVGDHAYALFKYPNNKVFLFTSITTNKFDHYYDQIMGTLGTIYLTGESEGMLFKEGDENTTDVAITQTPAGAPVMDASKSRESDMAGRMGSGSGMGGGDDRFAAYGIELMKFAEAVRKGDPSFLACDGVAGHKSAMAVLKAIEAMDSVQVENCLLNPEHPV
jgi:predicted dehydrogenase